MWTPATRRQHSRPVIRYQTDLTDAEWRVIAPHLPKPCATGRPREWPMREIVNGIGDRAIVVSMTMRWMAEITYRNGGAPEIVQFEEIADLHDIVEMGPDWNEIEQIVVTLNLSSATLQTGAI